MKSKTQSDHLDCNLELASKDGGLNKTDKLFVGRGARLCAPPGNAEVIKFLFLTLASVIL